jgi:4-hydroxybenzoate polyprenyltransferase
MPRRTTRHGRTERNRLANAQVSVREVAVVYGAMVLVPVLLWLVANPLLAVGVGALVAVTYATVRLGRRMVRGLLGARRAA